MLIFHDIRPARILLLVGATLKQRRRSGIHRVTLETARALSALVELDLVRWDALAGGLRFLDADELDALFGPGDWPNGVRLRPTARRVGAPFRESAGQLTGAWLLVPEVAWQDVDGVEILGRTISQCREQGIRIAGIFYDLIPILNPLYSSVAAAHEAYIVELTRCDLIIPISQHSGSQLNELWKVRGVAPTPPIVPLLLPDGGFGSAASLPQTSSAPGTRPWIALVGTVEPRKRQLFFLEAMAAARKVSPKVARYDVVLIGSLHPDVADAFNAFLVSKPWVHYLDFVSDKEIKSVLSGALFSAFVSDDEGYGLPISESLAVGTPCVCANFGAMAEIAAGGGCLTVDVRSPEAMRQVITHLCEQPAELERLRAEIIARPLHDWKDYALSLLDRMAAHAPQRRLAPVRTASVQGVLDDAAFARAAAADVLEPAEALDLGALMEEAVRRRWPALLPTHWGASAALDLAQARGERERIALAERVYAHARAAVPAGIATRPVFLRLLISTFNRRDFVVANVRWLLSKVLGADTPEVDVVVVDGGSVDGTQRALTDIVDPRFRLVQCPVNVGMLAGLREAARTLGAEYVWIIGDDDFVRPDGLRAMLTALRGYPGAPLGAANFTVYHRAAWNPGDGPSALIAEARPIADRVAPSGRISIRAAAEQTDNMFTAIYAIVWRADVLATAFDHAFDGEPFSDLVQAVPCTDLILRRFGACDLAWIGAPVVAGNAHNGWSRWRPRWHAVVMPKALALAREIGVDAILLQSWADTHLALFREAMQIAEMQNEPPRLSADQLELAKLCFRTNLAAELGLEERGA